MAEHITLDALMQSSGHTALQVQEPASVEAVRAQVEELSPEQKARVEEVKNSIDLMDSQAALQYGVGAQRNISSFSDNILTQVRSKDSGHVGELMSDLVLKVKPHQVTLVPDSPTQLTSNAGWDTKAHFSFLSEVLDKFNNAGIRTSVFVDADPEMVEYAAKAGADRVELYTGPYAVAYSKDKAAAIAPFVEAGKAARSLGIGLNAGHDLSLENLNYFYQNIPWMDEVSIGHALICDALYLGLEHAIEEYKNCLR